VEKNIKKLTENLKKYLKNLKLRKS